MELLRRGDAGSSVSELHQQLLEAGASIASADLDGRSFGQSTYAAVRDFQARHTGPDGHALGEDGLVGDATRWALENRSARSDRFTAPGWRAEPSEARHGLTEALYQAVGSIGSQEQPWGSNRGPQVDKWTGMLGRDPREPGPRWCAYFVSAMYQYVEGGSPFGKLGSALSLRNWGQEKSRLLLPADVPEPGDVFILLRANGHGHCGLVGAALPGGMVATIEGNASQAVRGLLRPTSSFTALLRPLPRG